MASTAASGQTRCVVPAKARVEAHFVVRQLEIAYRTRAILRTICPSRAYSIGTSTPGSVTSTTGAASAGYPAASHKRP